MSPDDDPTLDILRAIESGLPVETAARLLRGGAPAEKPAAEKPEPEPPAASAAPMTPEELDREAGAYLLSVIERDLGPRAA